MMRGKWVFVATVALVGTFLLGNAQAWIYYDNSSYQQNNQYAYNSPRSHQTHQSKRVFGFPEKITPPGKPTFIYSPRMLTWAAYDSDGDLIRTGPGSGGRGYCPDIGRSCRTPVGVFHVYSKQGPGYRSKKFPVGRGGAPMPWAMFFRGGFAIHGAYSVPDFNASHGCIRVLPSDARWLNNDFLTNGSPVIVRSY